MASDGRRQTAIRPHDVRPGGGGRRPGQQPCGTLFGSAHGIRNGRMVEGEKCQSPFVVVDVKSRRSLSTLKMMRGSRHARRIDPMYRSTFPLCPKARGATSRGHALRSDWLDRRRGRRLEAHHTRLLVRGGPSLGERQRDGERPRGRCHDANRILRLDFSVHVLFLRLSLHTAL
jgi:hypothetical protein